MKKRKRQAKILELLEDSTPSSEFPNYSAVEHELNHTVYRMAEQIKRLQAHVITLEAANNDLKNEIAQLLDD